MDFEKILIYIFLGLIYYGFKFLKKRNERPLEKEIKTKPAPVSFETFKPDPKQFSKQVARPDTNPETLRRRTGQEESYRDISYSEARSLEGKGYESGAGSEKTVIENVNPYLSYRSVSAKDTEKLTGDRFAAFETIIREQHPIKKVFADKVKIREAFIVSEILKRKVY